MGIDDSKLDKHRFGSKQEFNNKYNRFFRSTVLYALKCFFPNKKIIVEDIFHEEGQQQHHEYFPWHSIYRIETQEENISFNTNEITFLPKDHRKDERSNIIQLADLLLGLCKSILHGIKKSKTVLFRKELLDLFLPLFQRMIEEPENKNSRYSHAYRIMIRFFPKNRSGPEDLETYLNQFYTNRNLRYIEQKSGQLRLSF